METASFQKTMEMVYSRVQESFDLFKGCSIEVKNQDTALYLNFLADKKAKQASIIKSIAFAYRVNLNDDLPGIHQRFLRYEHELLASDLRGIYETVTAVSEDDISHLSTMLAFETERKTKTMLMAAIDYERDFIIDCRRGYLLCLKPPISRTTVPEPELSETVYASAPVLAGVIAA
jgi:hypothetical protein